LSELLRWQGLSRGQRIALQLAALLDLVHSLRAVTLSDDLTGLYNRRGFIQVGTRLLEVAAREQRIVHLVGFGVDHLMRTGCAADRPAGDVLLRQMGNLLRDLFPNYGIYEVLGRVSAGEFAALTTSAEYASRSAVLLRARRPQLRSGDLPVMSLSIGVAHFDPQCPASVEELMQSIRRQMQEGKRITQIASSGPTPRPG
jgi:diguanylate cyclase (GGDEF)-like protein